MQVVYAGGSSTPSPSPRLQRKNYAGGGGYGRPVMPGYLMGHPHQPSVLPHNHQRPSREKLTEGDASLRDSIPAMSKPVAVTCLVLNVVLPGMGTFVSGLTVMCGSQVRPKGASRRSVVWTNSGVALVQFFLTFLFLLGWIWSIMWGTAFLSISEEYYKKSDIEEVSTQGRNSKHSPTPKREHNSDNNSSAHHHAANPSSSSSASSSRNHNHAHSHAHGHAHAQPHAHHSSETHHHHHNHHQQRQPVRNGMSVNTVGGTLATNPPDIYINPSSSLPSCERTQPIIVLQAAPIHVNHSVTPPAPSRVLMNARTRHEKILQRQMSDNELSPFILTHQKLEAIVIHDAPIVQRPTRLQDVDETDPNFAPLPKS